MTKLQIPNRLGFENWNLKFVWLLYLVIWNFQRVALAVEEHFVRAEVPSRGGVERTEERMLA